MASKTFVVLVDDITGETIEEGAGETLTFAFDGVEYEIDLDNSRAAKMRDAFQFYADHARRIGTAGRRPGPPLRRTETAVDSRAVRAWAAAKGIKLSNRGRIPAHVIEQYRAAGN